MTCAWRRNNPHQFTLTTSQQYLWPNRRNQPITQYILISNTFHWKNGLKTALWNSHTYLWQTTNWTCSQKLWVGCYIVVTISAWWAYLDHHIHILHLSQTTSIWISKMHEWKLHTYTHHLSVTWLEMYTTCTCQHKILYIFSHSVTKKDHLVVYSFNNELF